MQTTYILEELGIPDTKLFLMATAVGEYACVTQRASPPGWKARAD